MTPSRPRHTAAPQSRIWQTLECKLSITPALNRRLDEGRENPWAWIHRRWKPPLTDANLFCKHTSYSLCKARAKGDQLTCPKEPSCCNAKESDGSNHTALCPVIQRYVGNVPLKKKKKKDLSKIHASQRVRIKISLLFYKMKQLEAII